MWQKDLEKHKKILEVIEKLGFSIISYNIKEDKGTTISSTISFKEREESEDRLKTNNKIFKEISKNEGVYHGNK